MIDLSCSARSGVAENADSAKRNADESASAAVTVYTAKRDGTFVARCHSIPGFVVEGETFDATVAAATEAYLTFCRKGIWN